MYQDPLREDQVNFYNYSGELKLPYGLTDAKDFQPFQSSSFPQGGYGVGSLFNPRVGKPEQSIYYNAPEPADPTSDFYQPLPGFINAPQNYYAPIQQTPSVPVQDFQFLSSAYEDDDEEQVEYLPGQEPKGIAKLFEVLGNIPTPFNLARRGLESLQGFNQRIRNTDFGRSKTLAEYFDRRSRAKNAARMAEKYQDFSEKTSGAGATGGEGNFSTPAGKSTSYEAASRAFGTGR